MVNLLGDKLFFIVSQPRAGSTLLQRVLGSHPEIHTVSEPWLMLHPLYALRRDGCEVEYEGRLAWSALRGFLRMLPGGEGEYIEGVRRMYTYLYGRALTHSGKQYFLDKTPRYYLVIPELYRTFPNATYIILLRNPLDVLLSVLKTWVRKNLCKLYRFRHDLIQAPRLLLEGAELLGNRGMIVHYEQLVTTPETEVQRICDKLGIGFCPEMIEYGNSDLPRWLFGDQGEIYGHSRPISENTGKWTQALDDAQIWRLASEYLQALGREVVTQMRYPYDEWQEILEAHRPHPAHRWFTFSLAWLLEVPAQERRPWARRKMRLARSLRQRGICRTAGTAVRKAASALIRPD